MTLSILGRRRVGARVGLRNNWLDQEKDTRYRQVMKLGWYVGVLVSFGALMGWGIHHLMKGLYGYGAVFIGLYLVILLLSLYLRPWAWPNTGFGKLMLPFAVLVLVGLLVIVSSPMNYGYSLWMVVGLLPAFLGPIFAYWNKPPRTP